MYNKQFKIFKNHNTYTTFHVYILYISQNRGLDLKLLKLFGLTLSVNEAITEICLKYSFKNKIGLIKLHPLGK